MLAIGFLAYYLGGIVICVVCSALCSAALHGLVLTATRPTGVCVANVVLGISYDKPVNNGKMKVE